MSNNLLANSVWFQHQMTHGFAQRNAVANYAAHHWYPKYASQIYIGPGLSPYRFAHAAFKRQSDSKNPLDLTILTNNVSVLSLAVEVSNDFGEVFRNMQVLPVKGRLHTSLNAIVGSHAARDLSDGEHTPDLVVMGAYGMTFDPSRLGFWYYFDEEISAQEALATRPTHARIVLASGDKIGRTSAFRANVSLKSLLKGTEYCAIISSVPTCEKKRRAFELQIANLKDLLVAVAESEDPHFDDKCFDFQVLNEKTGRLTAKYSLVNNKFVAEEFNEKRVALVCEKKFHLPGLKEGIQLEETHWFDGDSSSMPLSFSEVCELATDAKSQRSYHLAAYHCTSYTTLFEVLQAPQAQQSSQPSLSES